MTLATQTIQNLYLPDGLQTVFPFGFKCMAQTNLGVYTIDKTSGARTKLSLGTHYNVTGVGVETGGSVVLVTPPPSTVFLFVISDTPLVQEQAYVEGDNFPAKSHERALDTLVRMMQERKGDIARCLSVPPEDNITLILPNAQARANAFLYFDGLGQIAIGDPESIAARSETAADEAEAAQAAAEAAQGLAETAQSAASEWAQNPEDDPVEPGKYSAYHWSKKAESAAQGGLFKVSADDTTSGYLETKMTLASNSGLVFATTSPGGDERRTIAADVGTTAGKLVQLDSEGALPAVSGANLTDLHGGSPLNGNFDAWLRGTAFADRATTTNTSFYGPELWGFNRAGDAAGLSVARVAAGVVGARYACKISRAAGNTGTAGLNAYWTAGTDESLPFVGRTISVGLWVKRGADYSGDTVEMVLTTGTGTDQREYAMTGLTACGSKIITPTTEFVFYEFEAVVPDSSTQIGLLVRTSGLSGTAGADDSITMAGLSFNRGKALSPDATRALCGKHYKSGTAKFTGQSTLTGAYKYWFTLPGLQMRAAPTMGATPSYTNASAFSWGSAAVDGAEAAFTVASAGGYASVAWTADAGF